MTVYILDRTLRADGLKVAVFRQQRETNGGWVDSPISPQTVFSLENILRELGAEAGQPFGDLTHAGPVIA